VRYTPGLAAAAHPCAAPFLQNDVEDSEVDDVADHELALPGAVQLHQRPCVGHVDHAAVGGTHVADAQGDAGIHQGAAPTGGAQLADLARVCVYRETQLEDVQHVHVGVDAVRDVALPAPVADQVEVRVSRHALQAAQVLQVFRIGPQAVAQLAMQH